MACEILNKTKVPYVFLIFCILLIKVSWCQTLDDKNVTDVNYEREPIMSRLNHIMDKPTKYSWLVDLYDHRGWMKRHFDEVSSNCSREMESYLEALRSEKEWAIRSKIFFFSLIFIVWKDLLWTRSTHMFYFLLYINHTECVFIHILFKRPWFAVSNFNSLYKLFYE